MLLNLEPFVIDHAALSYFIIFLGMFVEGEIFLLLASYFVHQGFLRWDSVLMSAFLGLLLGDLFWYFLGKITRNSRFGNYICRKTKIYDEWLDKNFVPRYAYLALFSKFLYYVNRLVPIIAGWHRFSIKRFLKIHLLAGLLWLAVYAVIGYLFSSLFVAIGLKKALRNLEILFIGLAVIFILLGLLLKRFVTKKFLSEREVCAVVLEQANPRESDAS